MRVSNVATIDGRGAAVPSRYPRRAVTRPRALPVAIGWALGCLLAGGCDSGGPFDYVPVEGVVSYDDGSPLPGTFELQFVADAPPQGAAHPRPARVSVAADGKFADVTSYKYGDGLIRGKHKVSFLYAGELVPNEYTSIATSPLIVEVTKSGQFLEIKVPKPGG